jgi:hypothetical protein
MAGWGASGVIPKGSMQLAAGICGVGVVFSFFQVCGSSAAPVAEFLCRPVCSPSSPLVVAALFRCWI